MEWELCFMDYDIDNFVPKTLEWGHTFCEQWMVRLWKNLSITCPMCRTWQRILNANDLPCTNHILLEAKSKIKDIEKIASLKRKYLIKDPEMFENVKEQVESIELIKIVEGELVYRERNEDHMKEKQDRFRPKLNEEAMKIPHNDHFVFTTGSYFSSFLYYRLKAKRLMFMSKRMKFWTHKYSWFERLFRIFGSVIGSYSILKSTFKYFYPSDDENDSIFDKNLFFICTFTSVLFFQTWAFSIINDWVEKKKEKSLSLILKLLMYFYSILYNKTLIFQCTTLITY